MCLYQKACLVVSLTECMHAQIQQIEIYSLLDPPIYKRLFIYAYTAIKVLEDEIIYEMNH